MSQSIEKSISLPSLAQGSRPQVKKKSLEALTLLTSPADMYGTKTKIDLPT